jgi:hypothetical protein
MSPDSSRPRRTITRGRRRSSRHGCSGSTLARLVERDIGFELDDRLEHDVGARRAAADVAGRALRCLRPERRVPDAGVPFLGQLFSDAAELLDRDVADPY